VDHCYDIIKTCRSVVVSEKFQHMPCVPMLITSSSIIVF
jgi:hypothetical protein